MIAIVFCGVAFLACYVAGRRSLGWGLVALFCAGYFYGILRANLITTFSHFIFDAGLCGLYFSQTWFSTDPVERRRLETIRMWLFFMIGWPLLVFLMPFQPFLVSVVGLRGNIFFVPIILLGCRLTNKHLRELSIGLAVLNVCAFVFAGLEYVLGITRFYPVSAVTTIMYSSGDVAGGFYRLPATFTSAHAFGGTMVGSLPYLVGLWSNAETKLLRTLALSGMAAAMIGILMSATRLNFILGAVILAVSLFTTRLKMRNRIIFLGTICLVALLALTNERLQRFKTLGDAEGVSDRIAGSVNRSFFEILAEYPMGNGLGGGGSSMPYFLEGEVRNPIGMENEYARILSEQGIVGFLIWFGFVLWFSTKFGNAFATGSWMNSRRIAWSLAAFGLATAWIGVGMLTSIPGTALSMLGIGWTALPYAESFKASRRDASYGVPGGAVFSPMRARRS